MNQFEKMEKREQDAILFLAFGEQTAAASQKNRREFHFLGKYLKRVCFEALLGISSHRVDRVGALDLRYGSHPRPSPLTASIDSFCMVLYNSVAEPLPNKQHGGQKDNTFFGGRAKKLHTYSQKQTMFFFIKLLSAKVCTCRPGKGTAKDYQIKDYGFLQ